MRTGARLSALVATLSLPPISGMSTAPRGAFEYYTNDDFLTENWQPRELEHSLVSFTEWAVEGELIITPAGSRQNYEYANNGR